jgi:hypothetical protein
MNNLIGIAGVFVLTFSLIALYHLLGAFGRHSTQHGAQNRPLKNRNQQHRATHEELRTPDRDDSWLRWNGEIETPSSSSDVGRGEDIRRSPQR